MDPTLSVSSPELSWVLIFNQTKCTFSLTLTPRCIGCWQIRCGLLYARLAGDTRKQTKAYRCALRPRQPYNLHLNMDANKLTGKTMMYSMRQTGFNSLREEQWPSIDCLVHTDQQSNGYVPLSTVTSSFHPSCRTQRTTISSEQRESHSCRLCE